MERFRPQRAHWRSFGRYVRSYLPDWILALLLYFLANHLAKLYSFQRLFSLDDISIQYPYADRERINRHELHIITELVPALVILVISLGVYRSFWDLHNAWLGLAFSLSLTNIFTTVTKICVGRPRPDLIDRCQPAVNANHWGLVDYTVCTQTDLSLLGDGFRSFPSGHASMSFAGLGYLSLYIAGKLHLWDERGYTAKAWLAIIPMLGASLIAISRTMDYRHHWQDILAGSILGMTFAYLSYRLFFPSLTHPASHKAFKPRVRQDDDNPGQGNAQEREPLFPPDVERNDTAGD